MTSIKRSLLITFLLVAVACLWLESSWAATLAELIAKVPRGAGEGQIDPTKPAGFLGISGAPSVNLVLTFVWAVWVGWIFSTVGAFGGVMAGVGHISVFGFGAYAKSFKKTSPELNKLITDSIRTSNQWLVGLSAAISSFNYYKMGRLVLPLGLALGLGSLLGSWLSVTLTAGKVSFSAYQGYFGLFVLALGCYLFYQTTPSGQASQQKAKAATKAFEETVKRQKCGEQIDTKCLGVKVLSFKATRVDFTFYGVEFHFNPIIPVIGGVVISAIAAFLGVGGGFLLVPFLTSVAGLPMYLAAGTSALAVFVGMATSIGTFMSGGVPIDWSLIGLELIGVVVGSVIGPRTSKYIPEVWLKRLFILLALYVGVDYILRGFFDIKMFG